ncbi:MAG: DUF885 domain-containing protein [Cytophagales bacterium]|nr:MAG: DUF885 domain-containing protein [Cytophagales bacterium]
MKKYIAFLAWSVLFAGIIWVANTLWYKPFDIEDFYERVLIEYGLDQPERLTRFQIWKKYGISFYNDELSDLSMETAKTRYERLLKSFEMLRSYKRSQQNARQLVSTDILDAFLENEVHEYWLYRNYHYPINHIDGAHLELPFFMVTEHPINSYSDAEDYIHRLNKFETYFDELLVQLKSRQDSVLFLPNFMVNRVLSQMGSFINTEAEKNILYTEFVKKVERLPNITPQAKRELYYEVKIILEQNVYPIYRRMIKYLDESKELNNRADAVGIGHFEKGNEYYFFILKKYTNMDISPDELHQVGIEEVERINKQIREVLDSLNFVPKKPLRECLEQIYRDPTFFYDSTKQEPFFPDIEKDINELADQLHYMFEIRAKAKWQLEPMPPFKTSYAPLITFESSSTDGESPSVFFFNKSHIYAWHKFEQKAWICQDILLGKHFPTAIQREADILPTFRRIIDFEAFNKGWASYSLELANEYGYFKTHYEKLGMLHLQLINAASMVVDTGINSKGWTREQALAYMAQTTMLDDSQLQYQVDYTIIYPAKACAYYGGHLRISELREKAQKQLSSRFDIKEFHDHILENGSVPLDIMTKIIDSYIEKTKKEKL